MVPAAEIPPEILVAIFEYNECHKDLLNFALVCRGWTEWAIDVGWRTCEAPLYEIFAILDLSDERDPGVNGEADWVTFVAISNKVTKVKCNFFLPSSEATNFYQRRKQHDVDALFPTRFGASRPYEPLRFPYRLNRVLAKINKVDPDVSSPDWRLNGRPLALSDESSPLLGVLRPERGVRLCGLHS